VLVSRGCCFGFEVESELEFAYLREGAGTPLAVEVGPGPGPPARHEPLLEWLDPYRASLHANGTNYRLLVEGFGSYEIDPGAARILVPESAEPVVREERLWGIPAVLAFAARGDLPLHAAAVEVDGEAVLIAAPGVYGKTTLAAAFACAGHRILAEDLSCLRLVDGAAAVVPGPAMLRLRRDVADELELPPGTVVLDEPLRVHLALDQATRGDCLPVPVRAVVVLKQGEDEILMSRVEAPDAIRDLLALSFRLPQDDAHRRAFEGVVALVRDVHVWELVRPQELAALPAVVERIVADV
jgi:hypothetical protein